MAETNINTVKKCSKCQIKQDVDNFHRNKAKPDGRATDCKKCVKENNSRYYEENREKVNAQNAAYRLANLEQARLRDREYGKRRDKAANNARNAAARAANPERNRAYQKKNWYKYYEKNLERKRVYRKATPELQLVYVRNRQTRQKKAMPKWADIEAIKVIYAESARLTRETGIKHHVDHYFPLKSDVVCGLHNEFNLRIIPATDNLSKGNSFPEDHL